MANISRYDPFDDFFRGFFVRPVEFGAPPEAPQVKIDVRERADAHVVHAELPGVKKEDIHVHIDGAQVSLTAERKAEHELREGERPLRTERYFGKLARSFQLGQEIDDAKATAKLVDGVLEITLPKRAALSARRVIIE
jgi:HSP20 family protein